MECPVVNTKLGKVKGRMIEKAKAEEAKQVYAYYGIPFAKPPLGELRFENPQKVEPWEGILDATKNPATPVQNLDLIKPLYDCAASYNIHDEDMANQSEDCLYLNIYTSNPDKTANLPVLFWIYGGGFILGSNQQYNGQVLCGLHDVVLVVPNYRVNVFGFFNMGKETKWRGNMGLMDQVSALKWTRDNIKSFGGNPDNVTIFGESAGAMSVSLHVYSPRSRGLFHRAISHSGAGNFSVMLQEDASAAKKVFLDGLKITETEPEAIMRELKKVSTEDLIKAVNELPPMTYFGITVDGTFLPDTPENILKSGGLAPVPYIIGTNNTEGSGVLTLQRPQEFHDGYDQEEAMKTASQTIFPLCPKGKTDEAAKLLAEEFMKIYAQDDKYKWSRFIGDIIGDAWFIVPSIEQAILHSDAGHPTYMYHMTQKFRLNHEDEYSDLKKRPPFCEADHGDDLYLTFGAPLANGKCDHTVKFTEEETELVKTWMNYICNFAETGDPNKGSVKIDVEWPKYSSACRSHLNIRWPLTKEQDLIANRYKLWKETIPALASPSTGTWF